MLTFLSNTLHEFERWKNRVEVSKVCHLEGCLIFILAINLCLVIFKQIILCRLYGALVWKMRKDESKLATVG